ncbi:hypothetical protein BEP19_02655 [Ammoniphilus oxalaticus]|uniref:Copper amine oxidase n=1 Tax=Ammoniphilus oxalaticus TaxID=66863 RepID=A0A419SNN4_9BACL|nr:stalk domain-containing protein [Ammoniphilus oxalaticus]RKD25852.1 hypothetical protein BEP19_02655 [Ammoniphilus oxalaticus]
MKLLKFILSFTILLLILPYNSGDAHQTSVAQATKRINGKNVSLVYIDLNNKNIEVKPVLARNQIGATESLESMAKRSNAFAAMNGTFFMSYEKGDFKPPWGTILIDRDLKNQGWTGASIGFKQDNTPSIGGITDLHHDDFQHMTSAGPTLLKNGQIVLNPLAEGMTDPKLTTLSGQRSFIGYTADKKLVMGTVPNVTLPQLAQICKQLGLDSALNMDGGASSGLYASGKYITAPGRLLSNALVVVPRSQQPIKIKINGAYHTFDVQPFIQNGRTLVPLAGIANVLQGQVDWEPITRTVTITKDHTTIQLTVDSKSARMNGVLTEIDAPAKIVENRTMVPLSFFSTSLGASVEWNEEERTVEMMTNR